MHADGVSRRCAAAMAWSNVAVDKSMPDDPRGRALMGCKRFAGRDCQLYVVDEQIVYRAP